MARERRERGRDLHCSELALAQEARQIPPTFLEAQPKPSLWSRVVERARSIWTLLWAEHTTPREIAIAVSMGVFVGCTPAFGLHGWIALGLATLFRLNRIWSWMGSRISNVLIYPWIVIGEIELGHYLRFGDPIHLSEKEVLEQSKKLIVDWIIGSIPVAIVSALVFGAIAFGLAHLRLRKNPAPIDPVDAPEVTSEDVR